MRAIGDGCHIPCFISAGLTLDGISMSTVIVTHILTQYDYDTHLSRPWRYSYEVHLVCWQKCVSQLRTSTHQGPILPVVDTFKPANSSNRFKYQWYLHQSCHQWSSLLGSGRGTAPSWPAASRRAICRSTSPGWRTRCRSLVYFRYVSKLSVMNKLVYRNLMLKSKAKSLLL